jgi:hypothetical protein
LFSLVAILFFKAKWLSLFFNKVYIQYTYTQMSEAFKLLTAVTRVLYTAEGMDAVFPAFLHAFSVVEGARHD